MLLDRYRVRQLITLSGLEKTAQGPERLVREEDVAILVKAAYDDASAAARAAFMERVKAYPESAWPWSAVAAALMTTRGGGGVGGLVIVAMPKAPPTPAALILLRGQVDSAEADPGNRLPDRGSAEAVEWEPLYKALDSWDTVTIQKFMAPGGWRTPGGTSTGDAQTGVDDGGTSGAPADTGTTGPGGGTSGSNGESGGPPATQAAPGSVPRWVVGLAVAGGTALVVGTTVALVRGGGRRNERALEDELRRQQGGGR